MIENIQKKANKYEIKIYEIYWTLDGASINIEKSGMINKIIWWYKQSS